MIHIRLALVSYSTELLKLNDIFNGEGCNTLTAIRESMLHNTQEIVCVAEDGNRLVGFCCGQIFKSICYNVNYGEITELFVLKEHRRQGVAGSLVTFIETAFTHQGINHFQLFTGRDNQGAQAFYRSRGYSETSEILFRKRPEEK